MTPANIHKSWNGFKKKKKMRKMITRESQSSASQSNENMKRVHKLAFPNRLFTVLSLKSLVQDQQVYL